MTYLALGDSYTIGEALPFEKNFPSLLSELLTKNGTPCTLDKVIAVTGWTTDELLLALEEEKPSHNYDLVTLLIGVNNQYRGRSMDEYRWQFYTLLCQAILYAGGKANQVVVLSIPDWGLTPFNKEIDRAVVSAEIDAYNAINEEITRTMGCHYINITTSTRMHANDLDYLVADQLHYSDKEYALWAEQVAQRIQIN